jgi:DNA-binding NarL/FixJ family response regulator
MTDVQLKCINDGNKHFQLHKPSHSTKQKLISAKTLYIITLLDSGLSEAQICDQTGFSSATISYVHS